MAYDIRLMKLLNGEIIIGKYHPEENLLKDVAALQTVPTEAGYQMLLMPFGYPFENEMTGVVSLDHVLYLYAKCPEELQTKYLEASSNLTISGPGTLRNLDAMAAKAGGKPGGLGGLILKK